MAPKTNAVRLLDQLGIRYELRDDGVDPNDLAAETVERFDIVSISAGQRGLQVLIAPTDYLRATKGRLVGLSQPKKKT